MFPRPLNSSKMTSSIREPVSTRQVARIVSEPSPLMLRAAPKNRFGGSSALGVDTAGHDLAGVALRLVVGARHPRERVEQDDDVVSVLDETLRAFEHELGHAQVVGERLVERRRDDVRILADRLLPVVGLLRTLVDEQDEQLHFGMVRR